MTATDLNKNNDPSSVDRALRIVSLSTACAVVQANQHGHLDGDTYLALMLYLAVGRRAVLAQTSPSLTYNAMSRIHDLSECTSVLRALQLDREARSDDGAKGQKVHTSYVLNGLEKNHARLVTQTLIGAHFTILRAQKRGAIDGEETVDLDVEQTCTASTQPNEGFHGKVRTRGPRGTHMSDSPPLAVYSTIVDAHMLLTTKVTTGTVGNNDHRRTHVTDGGVLTVTSKGPSFSITGTNASALFRDALLQVLQALWRGWSGGFRVIPTLAVDWTLTGAGRDFVSSTFSTEQVRNLLVGMGTLGSLRLLQRPHDTALVTLEEIVEWMVAAGVARAPSTVKTKADLYDYVETARGTSTLGLLAWYKEKQHIKENRIWRVATAQRRGTGGDTAGLEAGQSGGSGAEHRELKRLGTKNKVRQWLARSLEQVFDGRKKTSRVMRYGSSTHRRLQVNHVLVAQVLGELQSGGVQETPAHLCLGAVVLFWTGAQGSDSVAYGLVTWLPKGEVSMEVHPKGKGSKTKSGTLVVRPLVLSSSHGDGDYYSVELRLEEVPLGNVILHFVPVCKLPPSEDRPVEESDDDDENAISMAISLSSTSLALTHSPLRAMELEQDLYEDGEEDEESTEGALGLFMQVHINADAKQVHREAIEQDERRRNHDKTTTQRARRQEQSQGVHTGYVYE